jgi:hypothetical protein
MSTPIPPARKRRTVIDPATGQEREERYRGEAGDIRTKKAVGEAWEGAKAAGSKLYEWLTPPRDVPHGEGMMPGMAAPRGAEKDAERAATRATADAAARAREPGAQPDNVPVTEPTSTGAGGPRQPTMMDVKAPWAAGIPLTKGGQPDPTKFRAQGTMRLHPDPSGKDPALEPGGFAHPSARAAGGIRADMERIEMLPEHGQVLYGPRGATGGHEWTLRKPGQQRAAYDAARYRREVQGRQASEDAAIAALDAQAAAAAADIERSKALEEQPFATEMAEVAGQVGAQRAKAQPRMQQQEMVTELFESYQQKKAQINADPNLDETQKAQHREEARQEFYMALAGLAGRDVTPREPMFGAILPPDEEA